MECPPGGLSASSGVERIRRGSSVGGSKPLISRVSITSTNTSLTYLLSSQEEREKNKNKQSSLSSSLYISKQEKEEEYREKSIEKGERGNLVTEEGDWQRGGGGGGGGGGIMAAAGEGKKGGGACELCGAAARVYCGADEATLCWGCDAQVHGANFLVARHARALLCRGCAQPTPWRATGPRLGPTASLCERCVRRRGGGDDEMEDGGDGPLGEEEDEDNDEEVVVEDDDEEEEGEGENQVVPWSEEAEATPPPVASSTSSSSREAAANGANAAECAKEDVPCSTSQPILCHYASSARHSGGRSDEATSSRIGDPYLATRHRKRSPSDFLSSGSAQSGSGAPERKCSNAAIGRNNFS